MNTGNKIWRLTEGYDTKGAKFHWIPVALNSSPTTRPFNF